MITHVKLDFMATAATLIRTHANYVKTCGGVGASVWYMRVVPAWETTGCWKPATTNGCQHQTCVMGHGVTQCPQTQGTVEQLTKAVFYITRLSAPVITDHCCSHTVQNQLGEEWVYNMAVQPTLLWRLVFVLTMSVLTFIFSRQEKKKRINKKRSQKRTLFSFFCHCSFHLFHRLTSWICL